LVLQVCRIDEQPLAKIGPDRVLAVCFGATPERGQVIRLDPREIVLGLCVDQPEHRIRVGSPTDMRDPPVVARDRDARGLHLPPRYVGWWRTGRSRQQGQQDHRIARTPKELIHGGSVRRERGKDHAVADDDSADVRGGSARTRSRGAGV
jgi:hypothetical protein